MVGEGINRYGGYTVRGEEEETATSLGCKQLEMDRRGKNGTEGGPLGLAVGGSAAARRRNGANPNPVMAPSVGCAEKTLQK
jgi:hypothetical protein